MKDAKLYLENLSILKKNILHTIVKALLIQ
jgi:hypothetical protein